MQEKLIKQWHSVRIRFKSLLSAEANLIPPAMVIMVATLASRMLGLLREVIFSSHWGPARLDAYNAAFELPDFLTNLFVLGAFASAFIPVFARYIEKGEHKKAWKLANVVTTWMFVILTLLSIIMFILAPLFVRYLLVPDWSTAKINDTVTILRIMLLSPMLMGVSEVFSDILNTFHHFTASALAPVFYNLGIIGGALILVPYLGLIWGLGLGVVVGAAMHAGVQFIPALRVGYQFKPDFDTTTDGVAEVGKLAVPRMISMGVTHIDAFVDTNLSSFLAAGSVVMLNWATRLAQLPVGIFGAAIGTAAFPSMVQKAAHKDHAGFYEILFKNLVQVFYFTIPSAIILIVMRVELVRLMYGQGGKLDWFQTLSTAFALALFSISIPAQASIYLLNRAFYALQDTVTPVVATVISVVLNSFLSVILVMTVHHFSVLGLSFSIAQFVNMILLMALLYGKAGHFRFHDFPRQIFAIVVASSVMGAVAFFFEKFLSQHFFNQARVRGVLLETVIVCSLVGVLYVILAEVLGCHALSDYLARFRKKHASKTA